MFFVEIQRNLLCVSIMMMMMYEEELGISILIKMGEAMILNFKFQKYSKEEYVQ